MVSERRVLGKAKYCAPCANRPSRQVRPLTASLGYQHPDQLDETLATVLGKVIEDKPLAPGEGIIHRKEGTDLLPSNIDLAAMEITLVNNKNRPCLITVCQYYQYRGTLEKPIYQVRDQCTLRDTPQY